MYCLQTNIFHIDLKLRMYKYVSFFFFFNIGAIYVNCLKHTTRKTYEHTCLIFYWVFVSPGLFTFLFKIDEHAEQGARQITNGQLQDNTKNTLFLVEKKWKKRKTLGVVKGTTRTTANLFNRFALHANMEYLYFVFDH